MTTTPMTRTEFEAAAYRLLRQSDWTKDILAVVRYPKVAVKLGYDLPSRHRLDEFVAEQLGVPIPPVGTAS